MQETYKNNNRKNWLIFWACISLIAAHIGIVITLSKYQSLNIILTYDFWEAIFPWSFASFVCFSLTLACTTPTRSRALSLIFAAILFNVLVIFFSGMLVIYGPGQLIATVIWLSVSRASLKLI